MTIKFIDLYSGNPFSAGQIKMDGYVGVVFKAGQGAWADVPRYHSGWWNAARDAGLMTGWYWLCDSRHKSADHIDEMKKFNIFEDAGELGLWIDVEKPRISMSEPEYWSTPYAGHQDVVDFAYLITLQGVKPGIYTGPGAYGLVMRDAPKSAHDYLAQFDLWTAQYPYNYQDGASKPSLYGSFKNWVWWQYREGPDVNIFNGTQEEFEAKYGNITIPPTGGTVDKYTGTVITSSLNIRPNPNTSQPSLAKLQYNDKVGASEVIGGWWKLAHITRNGANMPLPAAECYAYEGATGGYIRTDAIVNDPPPSAEDVRVEVVVSNGVTTVTVNGVDYHA